MSLLHRFVIAALVGGALSVSVHAAPTEPQAVANHYADLVLANYGDAHTAAKAMQGAIEALIANPNDDTLAAARKSWIDAREWYGQTEAFRFYGGPIDSDDGPEPRINAWPMDEGYVDYVKGKAKAGIINNPKAKITREALISLNEKGGEENISTGWHAIEFILWGQDLSKTGPGARPVSDFIDGKGNNAERRRTYLKIVTDLLVEDLGTLIKSWEPNVADNYRSRFVKDPEAVTKMLTGLGVLSRGELAGERMEVALASQSQEDEHSCFSDNTHRDVVNNARGIQNVWEGRFVRADGSKVEGPSLKQLVADKDAKLADKVSTDIAASVTAAEALQAPFDREIVGRDSAPGRKRVTSVINSLKLQSNDLVQAAKVLGIKRLNTKV